MLKILLLFICLCKLKLFQFSTPQYVPSLPLMLTQFKIKAVIHKLGERVKCDEWV